MAGINKLIGLFDMSSIVPKITKEATEIPVAKTIKNGDKLISTGLEASGVYGKASINIPHKMSYDTPKIDDPIKIPDHLMASDPLRVAEDVIPDPLRVAEDVIPDPLKVIDGDDFSNTTTNMLDVGCESYTAKGIYGQDTFNPLDPMNKMDASSPFYNPDDCF